MVTITVVLEDDLAKELEAATSRTQLTREEIIKHALVQYISTGAQDESLIGLFDLGDPDLATKSEEILQAEIKAYSGWTTKE